MDRIIRKTLLYKTKVEYGDYTVNHILGCQHGCLYPCYAFNMAKRFGYIESYEDWISPKLVSNAIELLDEELPKLRNKIKSVQLSFTTDPFMKDYPEVEEMTLKIINRLNKDDVKVIVLTKSELPNSLQDTARINEYGITLVSLDEEFRKKYEPFTVDYVTRIHALEKLHSNGFFTWVSIEPYPTPNICQQNLNEILKRISFVDLIVFGRLHYNKLVTEYKDYVKYYNDCASCVEVFCKEHNIKCHIKKGTKTIE